MIDKIAVIYLVRYPLKFNLFENFIKSYKTHAAGIEHDLVIIFKGFDSKNPTYLHMQAFAKVNFQPIIIEDIGFDLNSYFEVALKLKYHYYFFLNSYSQINSNFWLKNISDYGCHKNVGLVGTSGSFESTSTNFWNNYLSHKTGVELLSHPFLLFKFLFKWALQKINYPSFPNPHIRTNGFMISRNALQKIKFKKNMDRAETLKLESGRRSITRQILKLKQDVYIVGKDSIGYKIPDWPKSRTFRLGSQENLIVMDNRSNEFHNSDNSDRLKLSIHSWGNLFVPK